MTQVPPTPSYVVSGPPASMAHVEALVLPSRDLALRLVAMAVSPERVRFVVSAPADLGPVPNPTLLGLLAAAGTPQRHPLPRADLEARAWHVLATGFPLALRERDVPGTPPHAPGATPS